MRPLVEKLEQITPDWLTTVLGDAGVLEGAKVVTADVQRLGNGMIARMVRVRLCYDCETSAPDSVVVKFPSDDAGTLQVAGAMGLYENEARFYVDIAPLLGGMSLPRCYFATIDQASGLFTLVLEDLSTRTRCGDVLTPCTLDECSVVLNELVRFQAPLWNSPAVTDLAWLADPQRTWGAFDAMSQGLDVFLSRFGDKLKPVHVNLFETVMPKAGLWARSWTLPTVVQHGDFRADNLLFGTVPGTPAVTFIDFQAIRLAPPGLDPAHFLGSCLTTEQRRAAERELIGEYHHGLVSNGVCDFDFDACWDSYRAGAMYAVYLFVGMAGRVEPTERGDKLIVEQIARYADMALDLESPKAAGLVS